MTLFKGTVLLVSFGAALLALSLVTIHQTLTQAVESVKQSLVVTVFLQASLPDAQAKRLTEALPGEDKGITSYTFTSKEQALKDSLNDPSLVKSLVLLKENPFPASVLIRYNDQAWLERTDPTESLKKLSSVQEIRWNPQSRDLFRTLHLWQAWIIRLMVLAGGALCLGVFGGVYRLLSRGLPFRPLLDLAGWGAAGGILALVISGLILHSFQGESVVYHPSITWCVPIVASVAAGISLLTSL